MTGVRLGIYRLMVIKGKASMSTPPAKIRVAVLYGGRSAEHEVSLESAKNVVQYLDKSKFDVIPIGIDKIGNWFLGDSVYQKSLAAKQVPQQLEAETKWFTPAWLNQTEGKAITDASQSLPAFDVVFPAIHGTNCEDGTLQGLLELAGVPYVGCGVMSSAINMDKDVSKRLAMQADIPVPPFLVFKAQQWQKHADKIMDTVCAALPFPIFVKPANTGSSVGVSKVKNRDELRIACELALQYDVKMVIEQGITGHEIELAVLESLEDKDNPIVSVVGEIKPTHDFYSYDAKYTDENGAELCIPAKLPKAVTERAQQLAKQIFRALACEGMGRVDLLFDPKADELYFNEVNTLPGFTKISMYPKLLAASGISYTDLLTHLIELAIERFKLKNQLLTSKYLEEMA